MSTRAPNTRRLLSDRPQSKKHEIRTAEIDANGLRFAYLDAGKGPLVLLLHGFPDNAWTWSAQIPSLSAAGYRAVAPFLRGYPPTEIPADGRYDAGVLAEDVRALIGSLGEESAFVLGSDWGAVSAYAAMALYPEAIRRSVVIGARHPATVGATLDHPDQIHHIFHFWFFQQEHLAAPAVRNNDFRFVDYLWRHWSARGHEDAEHIAAVKRETLAPAGATEAALAYYPALLSLRRSHPKMSELMGARTKVPTLAVFGDCDPVHQLSTDEHVHFDAEYGREIVEGAGHFVQREQPETLNRLLLDWFAREGALVSRATRRPAPKAAVDAAAR
jgi:pimeloyl-ACP methyl ester carboxylesterase